MIDCRAGERKHDLAEEYLPAIRGPQGVFLILMRKAQAPVWEVCGEREAAPPGAKGRVFNCLIRDPGCGTAHHAEAPMDAAEPVYMELVDFVAHGSAVAPIRWIVGMADKNLRLDSQFSMIGAFWSPQTPDAFISNVVVTRNFYTNAGSGERSRKKPVKGKDMFLLNQKMRALLRGAMLLHLELPKQKIAEVLARDANKWR